MTLQQDGTNFVISFCRFWRFSVTGQYATSKTGMDRQNQTKIHQKMDSGGIFTSSTCMLYSRLAWAGMFSPFPEKP